MGTYAPGEHDLPEALAKVLVETGHAVKIGNGLLGRRKKVETETEKRVAIAETAVTR